jgi:hypothetical protein
MRNSICKVSKNSHKYKGHYAAFSLACRFIEAAETGKHFMVNNNACFIQAKKITTENGVLVKYDHKAADYFAVKV